MKKNAGYFKGFISGVLLTGFVCLFMPPTGDLLNFDIVQPKEGTTAGRLFNWMSYSIEIRPYDAFTQRCTKNITKNGHGWVFISRNYYGCNRVEIFISDHLYGETTSRNREDLRPLLGEGTY